MELRDKNGNIVDENGIIIQLTEEQKKLTAVYRDRGIAIGLKATTEPMNIERVKQLLDAHCDLNNIPRIPKIAMADSPAHALSYLAKAGATAGNALYGNQDIHWLQDFWYCREVLGLKEQTEKIVHLYHLCQEVSWMWMTPEFAVVCRLPVETHHYEGDLPFTNVEGENDTFRGPILHNENGRSVLYADGTGPYHLWGTEIPQSHGWVVDTPADGLDVQKVMDIPNTEIRTAAIRKIGAERLFDRLDKKLLSEKSFPIGGSYRLWDVEMGTARRTYLEMYCPSKGDVAIEGMDPRCQTVDQALAWSTPCGRYTEEQIFAEGFVYEEPTRQS